MAYCLVSRSQCLNVVGSFTQQELKLSKSAIKRAQKLARTERRLQQKALAKTQRGHTPEIPMKPPSPSSPVASSNLSEDAHCVKPAESSPKVSPVVAPPVADLLVNGTSFEPVLPPVPPDLIPPSFVSGDQPQPGLVSLVPLPATDDEILVSELVEKHDKGQAESLVEVSSPSTQVVPSRDTEKAKKRQSFITRTLWTFIMIGGFIGAYLLQFSWRFHSPDCRSTTPRSCVHDSTRYALPDARL